MKKSFTYLLLAAGALILIGIIAQKTKKTTPQIPTEIIDSSTSLQDLYTAHKKQLPANWNYAENFDEMDSKKEYYAQSKSSITVDFDFPYEGGSSFTLTIQHYKGRNNITLRVSRGQFLAHHQIRAKVDDEKPFYISVEEPSDGSADIVFLNPYNKIISKLKKAKKFVVEPEFYQSGSKQIVFDVAGLVWEH